MMKKTRNCHLIALLVSLALSTGPLSAQWLQSCRLGDTAYFLFSNSPRLERYSLANTQWLSPISLPTAYGAPTIWLDKSPNKLCIKFMRRKATIDPGVTYTVQFSSTLRDWVTNAAFVSSYSVNRLWECIRYEDAALPGDSCYCRVLISK
jgi:hypothetical protein